MEQTETLGLVIMGKKSTKITVAMDDKNVFRYNFFDHAISQREYKRIIIIIIIIIILWIESVCCIRR
jgi:Trk-type K+ transport system membrane component